MAMPPYRIIDYPRIQRALDGSEAFGSWQDGEQVQILGAEFLAFVNQAATLVLMQAFAVFNIQPDEATGRADTPIGENFSVLSDDFTFATIFRNDETEAVEVNRIPSKYMLDQLPTAQQIADLIVAYNTQATDPLNSTTFLPVAGRVWEACVNDNAVWMKGSAAPRGAFWSMAQDVASYIGIDFVAPANWATMYVDVICANQANAAGSVTMSGEMYSWALGETLDVNPISDSDSKTVAAPATLDIPFKVRLGPLTVDPSRTGSLRVSRQGASDGDTLANALGVRDVELVKAS